MTVDELKKEKIWVCWKYVQKDGKSTKKPCAADGGITGSNHAFRASWVTFEEARHAAEASSYSGVGFIIPKGMYFLDIDHRDEADAMVQLQIRRHDTYAEKSISGNGIHIYGCCDYDRIPKTKDKDGKEKLDPKFYVKNPHNKMELYVGGLTNRFAVFTGDLFHDAPLNDGTEAVLTTLRKDMLRKQPVNYRPNKDGDRAVFDIVCSLRKAKNGGKFARLFDRGDISEYGSASEADAALCALIAFRTGDDAEMIDAVFRMSALYRRKWEREDYKAATIVRAWKRVMACSMQQRWSIRTSFTSTQREIPSSAVRHLQITFGRTCTTSLFATVRGTVSCATSTRAVCTVSMRTIC